MLSRRKLFKNAAAVVAAPVLGARTIEYAVNTTPIYQWTGWLHSINQQLEYGWWWSQHPTQPDKLLFTTTLGSPPQVRRVGEAIDLMREPGTPWPTFLSDEQRDTLKRTTLRRHIAEYERLCVHPV